jgi:NAD-dependent dihydropyrimidine dehydrogenase PreA subunit
MAGLFVIDVSLAIKMELPLGELREFYFGPPRDFLDNRRFVHLDGESCVSCLRCMQLCPNSGVFGRDSNGKLVLANRLLCAGCSKCISSCPGSALTLKSL